MPSIKQFTRTALPGQLLTSGATAASFGGNQAGLQAQADALATGSAVTQQLGRVAGQLGKDIQRKQEEIQLKKDASSYTKLLSDFQIQNIRSNQELSVAEFEEGADLSQEYLNNIDERLSVFQSQVPDSMQDRFVQDSSRMRLEFAGKGIASQANRAGIKSKLNFENVLDNAKNIVALDDLEIGSARDLVTDAVEALQLSPEARQAALDAALDEVNAAHATSVLSNDPFDFRSRANAGEFSSVPNLQGFLNTADSRIQQIQNNAKQDVESIDLLLKASKGEAFLDPANKDHRDLLDKHYQEFLVGEDTLNELITNMDVSGAQMALTFTEKYKIVPESLQGTLRGMMTGGNPEQRQFAYNVVEEINSSGAIGLSEAESKTANTYTSLIDTGYNPEQAIEIVDLFLSDDFSKVREIREPVFKKQVGETNPEKDIKDFYDTFFRFAPDVSQEAVADYNESLKQEFLKTGDMSTAKKAALNIIRQKHKISDIAGGRTVMPFPPESFGHPALTEKENRNWMRDALKRDLTTLGLDNNLDKYKLFSTFENKDLVGSGQQPVYFIIDDDNDFVRNEDNTPLVYFFDPVDGQKIVSEREEKERKELSIRTSQEQAIRSIQLDPSIGFIDKWLAKRAGDVNDILRAVGLK